MIADIGRPDVETRRAIIQEKLEEREKEIKIPEKVIDYIADNVHHSIRELEGAINRLIAFSEFNDQKITLGIAEDVLGSILEESQKRLDPEKVIDKVSNFFEIKKKDLLGQRRFKELVIPRQITMYLLRHELNLSFPQIAELLNKKDHTTIIHGCDKVEKDLQKNKRLKKELNIIKEKIYVGG
jgi:chromosomal replication initiator protein